MPPATHVVRPQAARARRIALGLSGVAVLFSLGFGFHLRKVIAIYLSSPSSPSSPSGLDAELDRFAAVGTTALVFLLGAMVFRMFAALCELLWLERTWSNLPPELRTVGPVERVSSAMVVGFSFVPVVSYAWKLGLVLGIVDGFEAVRQRHGFGAVVPRRLGLSAVVVGWVPILNVYLAPFLWEMFARRIDRVCQDLAVALAEAPAPTPAPEGGT